LKPFIVSRTATKNTAQENYLIDGIVYDDFSESTPSTLLSLMDSFDINFEQEQEFDSSVFILHTCSANLIPRPPSSHTNINEAECLDEEQMQFLSLFILHYKFQHQSVIYAQVFQNPITPPL
jgi:hypothetical protein